MMRLSRFTFDILLVTVAFVVVDGAKPIRAADVDVTKPTFAILKPQFDAEIAEWTEDFDATKDGVDLVERFDRWPVWDYLPKFMRVAERDLQGDDAIDVAVWVSKLPVNERRIHDAVLRILELIEKKWMRHERLPELLVEYNGHISAPSERFVRSCLREGHPRTVRGVAHVTLASQLKRKALAPNWNARVKINTRLAAHAKKIEHPEWTAYLESIKPEEAIQESADLLETANDRFASVAYPDQRLSFEGNSVTVAEYIVLLETGILPSEVQRILQSGTAAPAIEGVDLNGQRMSLAEFRGSVVVIDFWATWCPPCLAQLDDLKRLANKYDDAPVRFVGFNVDSDASKARHTVGEEVIPWRSWHIANDDDRREFVRGKYRVFMYPWAIVLDKNGFVWFNSVVIDENGKLRSSASEQVAALDSAIQSCLNQTGKAEHANASGSTREQ